MKRPVTRNASRWLVAGLVVLIDCLIVLDAFSLAYILRFDLQLGPGYWTPPPPDEYFKAMLVVCYFWILLFKAYGLYDFSRNRSPIDTVYLIFRATGLGALIILSLSFFYREFSYSRLATIYAWAIAVALFCAFRVAVLRGRAELYRRGGRRRNVLLIGSRSLAGYLARRIEERPELGYRVLGAVDDLPAGGESDERAVRILGDLGDLERILGEEPVDRVFIANPALGRLELFRVIEICERRDIPLAMVPPTYDLMVNYRDFEEVDGLPLVQVNEREARRAYEIAKRVLDVALASVLLAVSAPVFAAAALLIWLDDGRPIIFAQPRVGRDGRIFRLFKFRTMVAGAEELLPRLVDLDRLEEPVFKLKDDPRVTRVGRWLRKTSLDELPQLINVLRGEMSLVGPRPEEEQVVKRYGIVERRRLKVQPGLTGLQQVKCRGSTNLSERMRWDILYLRKRSLLLDLWILLQTPFVVLRGKGAH